MKKRIAFGVTAGLLSLDLFARDYLSGFHPQADRQAAHSPLAGAHPSQGTQANGQDVRYSEGGGALGG